MSTLSLFSEFDTPQATGKTAVLVRSHLCHVKGSGNPTAPQTMEDCTCGAERMAECTCWPPAPHPMAGLVAEHFPAPHNGSTTSKAAALAVQSQQATQLERVLELITNAGTRGTTRADIAHQMGKPTSTICARVSRLLDMGEVREADEPRIPDCGGSVKQRVLVRVL